MYVNLATYDFAKECAKECDKEIRAGTFTRGKLKVLITVVRSDLANQKTLRWKFWEAWNYQGQIVKLKESENE